jgi:hypothetical protein
MRNDPALERRRHQRIPLDLLGRYMLPDHNEYPCQVLNISPGGIALSAPVIGELDDRVVVYLDHVGRIEGTITRIFEGGFALRVRVSNLKRERLADQLTWLANRSLLKGADARRDERLGADGATSTLILADGSEAPCSILDMSLSGASVETTARPPVGTTIKLGRIDGRVVRHHTDGIAIEFVGRLSRATLSGHFRAEHGVSADIDE